MKGSQFKAFQDKAFEAFVQEQSQKNENEIFSIEYEGKKYWVKKGRKTSSNLFHHLCYKLLPFEFLIPVVSKNEQESILFESNKLIEFKNKGLNVPDVIGSNEEYFVISDCGETLYVYLNQKDLTHKEFYNYLDKYIVALSKLHSENLYHGGAQSRNITYFNREIYFIDLEDSFDKSINIEILQFRDLLLMLLSLAKVKNSEFEFLYVVNRYIELSGNQKFLEKLKKLAKQISFLYDITNISFIKKRLSGDVKNFSKLLDQLKRL